MTETSAANGPGAVNGSAVGQVVGLWRYPVKSMMGEELTATQVTDHGFLGDRAWGLIDLETGLVASAKYPRKWPTMFEHRAAFIREPELGSDPPDVVITLADGRKVRSDDAKTADVLSEELGRRVRLASRSPDRASLEEYWPDIEGLALRETVTDEPMPEGTFFDVGIVHLLTTATIDALRRAYPEGRFEARRFRPNIVVAAANGAVDFVENDWVGHTVRIGPEAELHVDKACTRCVMTTLPQGDLPRDPGILRTAARENSANVGVYASVVRPGTIRRGDPIVVT